MSMETLNVIQFIQLFIGYIGFTVGLPALVFYRKVKRFPAAVRFLIYFTIGNFYVINLVQALELLHISYRITLILFTFIPVFLVFIKIYHIPVISYIKKLAVECRHYILQELGFKSFMRHRWSEIKGFIRVIIKNIWRLLKENFPDIPFLVIFALLMWKICGLGILKNWAYGASDLPVHNSWINGLIDNNIYIAGIYPMGMHCMLYYLSELLGMPVYVTLRLFWLVQYTMIAVMMLAFLKGHCKTRFLPYLGIMMFVGSRCFVSISYVRFGATLPQEFGMLYILPAIFFMLEFFRIRNEELEQGINRIRCTSSWYLLGFAMSFSLTLSSHFYDTIITVVICFGIAVGYGYWFWRKEYFFRIILVGISGVLMAFLPMAVAFLTGKSLQGSMYWAMGIIGLEDYTVPVFRIICFGVIAMAVGGTAIVIRGIRLGKISFENKQVPSHSIFRKLIFQACCLVPFSAVLMIGWKYREIMLWGCRQNTFTLSDMDGILYGIAAALWSALIQYFLVEPMRGAGIFSMLVSAIILGLVLVSDNLGWPVLMESYRVSIYLAYLIPVVIIMTLDGVVNVFFMARHPRIQQTVGLLLSFLLIFYGTGHEWMREPFGGGGLEMNEAILCTTNILRDNRGQNDTWTIVSANDELFMIEEYGRHMEMIEFLAGMEYWNHAKEVKIPTEKVYFYIEKKPIDYNNKYDGKIPAVSEEQAKKPLPANSGLDAYIGTARSVTMSRMYFWAQKFVELYPNEMKVYYENERFICYCIEQNVYRLYNFAIDYGYN